ncbi:MAG: hypothetical protein R3C30_00455 [Hyphomonadaceae bacterium]
MTLVLALIVPLIFVALPVGLSVNVRRYKQATFVLLICLIVPVIVGIAAVGLSNPTSIDGALLELAAAGIIAYIAAGVLVPLFCASVLWELGKFKEK